MAAALSQYGEAFRNLINARTWSGSQPVRELLKLNKETDWRFVCAAMDVIGDSESAIESFMRFGLEGPSRYEDTGEKYLRLYGLLSATYVQQESVVELYRLMNVPNPKDARKKVAALSIRVLRNKLASHSVNFKNAESGELEAYAPVQISLQGYSCEVASLTLDPPKRIDLKAALKESTAVLVELLDEVYEKTYKTLFKGQTKKLAEFKERLNDLRVIKDGGMVIHTSGKKIILHTVASEI